jgi:hypothetical protein
MPIVAVSSCGTDNKWGDNARLCVSDMRVGDVVLAHGGKPANNLLVVTDRQHVKGISKATLGLLKNAHPVFDHDKG